jgi:energy-coupling factor transporter ATP-binding protein EcfA2
MANSSVDYVKSRLRLRAMTLRGVGPYIDGSRIEIRPLTILCGENGSGKSTWLRALGLLKQNADRLPWGFNSEGKDPSAIGFTNAFYHLGSAEGAGLFDETQLASYGPPGTVGLEFDVVELLSLPASAIAIPGRLSSSARNLLSGRFDVGDKLRLRFADPEHWTSDELVRGLIGCAELSWNDCSIRFDCPLPFSAPNPIEPSAYQQYSSPSTLWCSPTCFSGGASSVPERVATFYGTTEPKGIRPLTKKLDGDEVAALIRLASSCMRELAVQLLAGFRQIGAIRAVGDKQDTYPDDKGIENRDVGSDGSSAWNCERAFAMGEMQLPRSAGETAQPTQAAGPRAPIPLHLDGFVSKWMTQLSGAGIQPREQVRIGSPPAEAWPGFPAGFLRSPEPPEFNLSVAEPLNIVVHPCFGNEPQYPKQMSAGFHQIFPMVVQSGIMGEYETTAVENPEAHLHPKLQLGIAEFFLRQANSDKQFIVETHSDLFVQRILREVLGEEIGVGQERIRIYFTKLDHKDEYEGAHAEGIQFDERRVVKWPAGFMDESVKESRRLINMMYGPDVGEPGDE